MANAKIVLTPEQKERIRAGRAAVPPVPLKVLAHEMRCSVSRVWTEIQALESRETSRAVPVHSKPRSTLPQKRLCMRCRKAHVFGWTYCRQCKKHSELTTGGIDA